GVEAAQEILVGLAAARVLHGEEAAGGLQHVGRAHLGARLELAAGDGGGGRGTVCALASDENLDRLGRFLGFGLGGLGQLLLFLGLFELFFFGRFVGERRPGG